MSRRDLTRKCKKIWGGEVKSRSEGQEAGRQEGQQVVEVAERRQTVTWSVRHATCRAAPRVRMQIDAPLHLHLHLQRSRDVHQKCIQLLDKEQMFMKMELMMPLEIEE